MSSRLPRHDEAVAPLLEGLRRLEALGLTRPAHASLNEFVEALIAREILPRSLGEEIISEYHNRRFGHSPDDARLERILGALQQATESFDSLPAEKRTLLIEQLGEQFRASDPRQRIAPVPPAAVIAPPVSQPAPEAAAIAPDFAPDLPEKLQSRWSDYWSQKAILRMTIAAAALWTLGVLISGYLMHDRLDVAVAKVRQILGVPSPEPSTERRHAAREDWRSPQQRRAQMLSQMADQFHQRNQAREALYAYHLTLYYDPSNSDVMNGLAWLLLTSSDKSLLDPARALPLAQRAVELNPSVANLDTLAEALYQTGDAAQALAVEQRAMEAGKDSEHRDHLAKQLAKFLAAVESPAPAQPGKQPAAASSPSASASAAPEGPAVSNAEPVLPRPAEPATAALPKSD